MPAKKATCSSYHHNHAALNAAFCHISVVHTLSHQNKPHKLQWLLFMASVISITYYYANVNNIVKSSFILNQ